LVHEEYHGTEYARRGGAFEMVQLWVNLPKKHKMDQPGYQSITSARIPRIELPGGAGIVRVIAGEYPGARGPARTFSPMNVWDMRLKAGAKVELEIPAGWTIAAFVLNGELRLSEGESIKNAELAVFEREGDRLTLDAVEDTTLLFLSGEPLNEPIVGYGPFVMNTQAEIQQAVLDFQSGKMGSF